MRITHFLPVAICLAAGVLLTGCSKGPTVDGTYVITKGPVSWPPATATLANGKIVFSAGASGDYTVSEGKVLLTGGRFSDVMQIRGDKLAGEKMELARTHTSPEAWAKDCSDVADAGDKAACLEVKKEIDTEMANRRAVIERSKAGKRY